jgi:hypothetical protein
MSFATCAECGARFDDPSRSCAERFDVLLALDHSRTEPWGSRHGQAFAAYTLQHPSTQSAESLERCWMMLCRILVAQDDPADVIRGLRRAGARTPLGWTVTAFPGRDALRAPFAVTIADLGDFAAHEYAERLDAWCAATLAAYGVELPAA